jgi:hypothetical protein
MSRFTSVAFVSAGLLALAACADNTPVSAPAAAPVADQEAPHLGIVRSKTAVEQQPRFNRDASNATPRAALVQAGIQYHGGPVLQAGTKVAAVYWASTAVYTGGPTPGSNGAGSGDGSVVGYFLNHIGGSPYFNINTSYTTGAGVPIANSVTYTQFWANNSFNVPSGTQRRSDSQMLAMLQNGFSTGKLTYDASTVYAIFTKGSVNLGGGFGTQYCAYHSWGNVTVGGVTRSVLYAAMPDAGAKPTACSNGTASPNADPHADAVISVLVHEIEETTTDMNGNAWWRSSTGDENADLCAWNFGTTFTTANGGVANVTLGTKSFLIQRNWLNVGSGSCQISF